MSKSPQKDRKGITSYLLQTESVESDMSVLIAVRIELWDTGPANKIMVDGRLGVVGDFKKTPCQGLGQVHSMVSRCLV